MNKVDDSQKLKLLFTKIQKRLKPGKFFELKLTVENGKIVDVWIMDKARTEEQLENL